MADLSTLLRNFFRAEDLKISGPRILTIKSVTAEDVGQEGRTEKKPIMRFLEDDRALTLNTTRYETCAEIFGTRDADTWVGKKIQLLHDPKVKFGPKTVGAIAVGSA